MQVGTHALDHITALLKVLFVGRRGCVLVLSAYFDESARPDAGDIMCVAGYVFSTEAYVAFSQEWNGMLQRVKPGGVKVLHMADLCAGVEDFAGVRRAKLDDTLRSAVEIINRHIHTGIAVSFRQDEFERMAPANWPKVFGSIYSAACQLTLQVFAHWATKHESHEPVAYFFETGHRYQAQANAMLDAIGRDPTQAARFHYHSHSFVGKADAYGLQAADVLSWEWTKFYAETYDQRVRRARESLKALILNDPSRYQVNLFRGETLRRFMQEQIDGLNTNTIKIDYPKESRRTFR